MKSWILVSLLLLGGCANPQVEQLQKDLADSTAQLDRAREDVGTLPRLGEELQRLEAERAQLQREWRRLRVEMHLPVDR